MDADATFVLVHGAWHGGWCWRKLAPLLRAAGHEVFAPTLTGLGERAHLLTPAIDLDTHIEDVVALLEFEDLHDVTLVGHSYAGMVIAGVAGRAHGRLRQLIFVDAFLPEDGRAMVDYAPLPPGTDDGWKVPPPATTFGVEDPDVAAWLQARLRDHPLRTLTQPVRVDEGVIRSLQPSYVHCSAAPWFAAAATRAARAGFRVHALPTAGHDVMLTQPEALARVLLDE
jgi:pimeloyl-ACP methyl ester carboxylesterase